MRRLFHSRDDVYALRWEGQLAAATETLAQLVTLLQQPPIH